MTDNKFWIAFWVSAFATIIAIGLMISNYNLASMPLQQKRIISEHNLKLACIQRGGNWQSTDHDNQAPYSCAMR